MEKYLIPFITSSVFSGIIIAYFHQLFFKRNKQFEQNLSLELKRQELALNQNVEKSHFQFKMVFESYIELWREMTDLEKYVVLKLPRELENGSLDLNFYQVRNAYHEFRKNMIFLPDDLYNEMNKIWEVISDDLNEFLQNVNKEAMKVPADKDGKRIVSEGEIKENVIEYLRHFQNGFSCRMNELRATFRKEMILLIPQHLK